MNASIRSSLTNYQANCFQLRAAFFHSTPLLESRRRSHWNTRCNHYSKRSRKQQWKQNILRNVSAYAEQLFQSWQPDFELENSPFPNKGPAWFRRQKQDNGSRRHWSHNQGCKSRGRRGFHFCEDDVDVETIFQSAFGGDRLFFWSFTKEDNPSWRSSSGYGNSYRASWSWRYQSEEEHDSSGCDNPEDSDLTSQKLALGLSASAPLKLDDVKTAFRACALKWHPDRHHGPTKGLAEEKFKLCCAAYQSLCDKLAVE
ncbi:hypothetical protein Nepgr_010048 [Nepenthes gracilis]|uniref:J domain-containing protein n=1 Tax=Nepenthes gracilis TaxID=150966 RepID=A0AAD3SBJ6_NEPGR|nr:hypothetical protein Nepgr_010048 [Nepenthes gracilis]